VVIAWRYNPQADPEFTGAGINGGQMARIVRVDVDSIVVDNKLPGLGVVATRGKRRIANEFLHGRCQSGTFMDGFPAMVGLLVVIEPGRILGKYIVACCDYASGRQKFEHRTTAQD
jgi:hypothetical protein